MNTEMSKSEFHAKFIHDIIEMEYKADALRTLAGQCRKKGEDVKARGEALCKNEQTLLRSKKDALKQITRYKNPDGTYKEEYETRYEVQYKDVPRKFWSWTRIIEIWLICFTIVFIALVLKAFFDGEWNLSRSITLIVLPVCLAFLINLIFIIIKPTEQVIDEVEKKVNKFDYYSSAEAFASVELERAEQNYKQALERKAPYDKTADELYAKALYLEKQADTLDANKNKMYALNIIPPDYRKLVYLFGFYKIFRNNLADTMREAILLYEERDYREKALSALNRIENKLGLISEYIVDMSDNLYRIGNDVNFMSEEIQNIRAIQENTNDKQNEMIEEIRATRYANEAVQRSIEQCEWYLHHQYWDI